jgi:hypothetical protein
MIRSSFLGLFAASLSMASQAAVVVTSDGGGEVSTQYFEQGEFVLMRGDKPSMGVDREGNCWFVQHRRVVSDPCEQMLQSVSSMREQAMAGLSAEERAMMERALQIQNSAPPASITKSADRKIAGYASECHRIGDNREVCISEKLLREIKEEMGESPFLEVFRRFGESAGEMGGDNPETKAMAELAERGFPMLDMRKVAAMPGLDPAVLQSLPEAQRTQILSQMGGTLGGQKMQGTKVIRVDRNGKMPGLDLSRYPRMGFEQFMQQSMGQMREMPGMR